MFHDSDKFNINLNNNMIDESNPYRSYLERSIVYLPCED